MESTNNNDFVKKLAELDMHLIKMKARIKSGETDYRVVFGDVLKSMSELQSGNYDLQINHLDKRMDQIVRSCSDLLTRKTPVDIQPSNLNPTKKLDIDGMRIIPNTSVLLDDLVGLTEIKLALLRACVIPVIMPHIKSKGGLEFHGALLFGASGVGKSKIIQALVNTVALKMNLSISFIQVKNCQILGNHYGDTERNITTLFDGLAQDCFKPAIIYYDELDAFAGARYDRNRESENKIINHFLSTLDGLSSSRPVAIVGSSNFPNQIDEAFYRRFRPLLYVQLPDIQQRKTLFKKLILKHQSVADIDFDELARRTDRYSQCDITFVVKWARENVSAGKVEKVLLEGMEGKKEQVDVDEIVQHEDCREIRHADILEALKAGQATNSEERVRELEKFAEKYCGFNRFPPIPDNADMQCCSVEEGCCMNEIVSWFDCCTKYTSLCFNN